MVFQIRGHRFSIFGSSISTILFRVSHPKLLHLKRNSFKTTIISPSMPYLLSKTINYLSKQTCYGQILQKHSWVIFIASHSSVSMLTIFPCQPFQLLLRQPLKISWFFKNPGHRFLFLGQHCGNSFGLTIQNFSI
jgi:hypothetical protein